MFEELKQLIIDTDKLVKLLINGITVWQAKLFKNQVPISTDTDGSIYNGTGYKDNARLSSSGGVSGSAQTGSVVTGFIPCTSAQTIRIKGAVWLREQIASGHFYIHWYNADKTFLSGLSAADYSTTEAYRQAISITYDEKSGVTTAKLTAPDSGTGLAERIKDAAFVRLNAYGKGADLIVTIDEEIN